MVTLIQMAVLVAAHGLSMQGAKSINDFMQPNLHDFEITGKFVRTNQTELKKINKDYALNYVFDSTTIWFKDPFKFRIESRVDETSALAIYNGPHLKLHVPNLHLTKREDLSSSPVRQETTLDLGLLVPSLFEGFFISKFVHMDRETGDPVFDITYSDKTEGARYRIWVDTIRHIVAKREWYNRYGAQLATFFYERPKEFSGIWIPTQITVKNIDNQVAAVTEYGSIRVNTGEAESLFSVD